MLEKIKAGAIKAVVVGEGVVLAGSALVNIGQPQFNADVARDFVSANMKVVSWIPGIANGAKEGINSHTTHNNGMELRPVQVTANPNVLAPREGISAVTVYSSANRKA